MSNNNLSGDASNLSAEACAWIAQLETGELTTADQEAFREWINRSPRHAAEIRFQAKMSHELNVLTDMAESISAAAESRRAAVSRKPRAIFSPAGIMAAAVVIGLIVCLPFVDFGARQTGEVQYFQTAIGEFREFSLADGSTVSLNTDSQIEVSFDNDNRRVRLLSGEAFFLFRSRLD